MEPPSNSPVVPSSLEMLRRFTTARIALGRAGTSLPTQAHLEFQLAHARARDAVHHPLDVDALRAALAQRGHDCLGLRSAAADRRIYLQRPDLGRRLSEDSRETLRQSAAGDTMGYDLAFVLADGLSALAIEGNAVSFLDAILPQLAHESWRVASLVVVEQGRVAVGDEIGETLRAQMVAILIGERPGLSSPDSMGIYLTYMPRVGATDAERNCISNIRPDGMSCAEAARKLIYLMSEARSRKLSGVMLKDESVPPHQHMASERGNFLVDKGQASS